MSQKDFELIARVVQQFGGSNTAVLAAAFAAELSKTNPRFDRDRFLKACGL